MTFDQVFKFFLFLSGVALIIVDLIFFDKNVIIATIGGLIIFASGVNVHLVFFQQNRTPGEIKKRIKEAFRKKEN